MSFIVLTQHIKILTIQIQKFVLKGNYNGILIEELRDGLFKIKECQGDLNILLFYLRRKLNLWNHIPIVCLGSILKYLNFRDIVQSIYQVCKTWCNALKSGKLDSFLGWTKIKEIRFCPSVEAENFTSHFMMDMFDNKWLIQHDKNSWFEYDEQQKHLFRINEDTKEKKSFCHIDMDYLQIQFIASKEYIYCCRKFELDRTVDLVRIYFLCIQDNLEKVTFLSKWEHWLSLNRNTSLVGRCDTETELLSFFKIQEGSCYLVKFYPAACLVEHSSSLMFRFSEPKNSVVELTYSNQLLFVLMKMKSVEEKDLTKKRYRGNEDDSSDDDLELNPFVRYDLKILSITGYRIYEFGPLFLEGANQQYIQCKIHHKGTFLIYVGYNQMYKPDLFVWSNIQ